MRPGGVYNPATNSIRVVPYGLEDSSPDFIVALRRGGVALMVGLETKAPARSRAQTSRNAMGGGGGPAFSSTPCRAELRRYWPSRMRVEEKAVSSPDHRGAVEEKTRRPSMPATAAADDAGAH